MQYLYHGSCNKLSIENKLLCHKQWNRSSSKIVSGVFATTSIEKAKYFGIVNCISANIAGSRRRLDGKKIYMEDLSNVIKPKFYIYLVDSTGFELDEGNEYICHNDVKILDVKEFDLVKMLDSEGWEIYKIPNLDKRLPINKQIDQMTEFINSGQASRVNIAALLDKK